jgi:hypothetical protein
VRALIVAGGFAAAVGCSQYATRPETSLIAPQEWQATLSEPVPSKTVTTARSAESRLRELETLREQRLISQTEYEQKRKEILRDL